MQCEYCDKETDLISEFYEVTCEDCQFEHYVMNEIIDVTPANDGTQSHVFICNIQIADNLKLTLNEAKAFLKNLEIGIGMAEAMEKHNVR